MVAQKSVKNKVPCRTSTFLPFVSFFLCQDHWRFLLLPLHCWSVETFLADAKDCCLLPVDCCHTLFTIEAWCNMEADLYSVNPRVGHLWFSFGQEESSCIEAILSQYDDCFKYNSPSCVSHIWNISFVQPSWMVTGLAMALKSIAVCSSVKLM